MANAARHSSNYVYVQFIFGSAPLINEIGNRVVIGVGIIVCAMFAGKIHCIRAFELNNLCRYADLQATCAIVLVCCVALCLASAVASGCFCVCV